MATLLYFAYGSNMLQERLVARVSTAQPMGVALLRGFQLDFAKVSVDGSGKGDLTPNQGGEVWGRLYEFDEAQKSDLDDHEGSHYQFHEVVVHTDAGEREALTYLANQARRDPSKVPFDWYLALITAGARQGELPDGYVRALEATAFDIDGKEDRSTRLQAIEALAKAGMTQMLDELRQRMAVAAGG